MKNRNPIAVFGLPFITFGIYSLYWMVKTKGEMNAKGEQIPTAWILLIPIFGQFYFSWKYSEGVEHITNGKTSMVISLLLLLLLGNIGQAILQDMFNKLEVAPIAGPTPAADTSTSPTVEPTIQAASVPSEPTDPKPPAPVA